MSELPRTLRAGRYWPALVALAASAAAALLWATAALSQEPPMFEEVATLGTAGTPYGVVVEGGYAHVADVNGGLLVVDISDPTRPTQVGALDTPGRAYGIVLSGTLAYVADATAGLSIVDIAEVARPRLTGRLDTPGHAWNVGLGGNHVYVADRMAGLRIVNVSDPAAPYEVGSLTFPSEVLDVEVIGDVAHVAAYQAGLQTVDVSDPTQPKLLGSYDTFAAYEVDVRDGLAFVADGDHGLRVFDVSNPSAPAQIARVDTPGWGRAVALEGDRAAFADDGWGVKVFDIGNPAAPVHVASFDTPGRARGIDMAGDFVYVADYEGGLRVLRLGPADPGTPNDPPVADAQAISTEEDTAIAAQLTGSDPNGDSLSFSVVAQPAYGALAGSPPELIYTPAANFAGSDSFSFRVNDGRVNSEPALVEIMVSPVNDAPAAGDDGVSTPAETPIMIDVLANDSDADGDVLAVTEIGAPQYGAAAPGEQILYTPAAGFTGTDVFTYTVGDGISDGVGRIAVTVRAGGDAGYALEFDGVSDYVRLASASNMLGSGWTTTKAVALWVKPLGTAQVMPRPEPSSCDALFGDRPRAWGISRCVMNGMDRLWVWNFDGSFDIIGVPYNMGEWIYVALTHHNGVLTAYLNGAAVGSVNSGPTRTTSTPILHVGGIVNSSTRNFSFEGQIDEVSLWSTPPDEATLHANLLGPYSGAESGLAAYYRMSEGSGSTVADDGPADWAGALMDGLPPGVPADGPIEWVASGAFGVVTAANAAEGGEVLQVEGQPEADEATEQQRLFLPRIQR